MLLKWVLITVFLLALVPVALAGSTDDPCNIPPELRREIESNYPGARVVSASDLVEDDKQFFHADHGDSCPGLAKVDFYGDGKPTLALILVLNGARKAHTQLVLARYTGSKWTTTKLGTGSPSPYAPVVWSQAPGEYRDVYGKRTVRATSPVVVFCKYEAWKILYAWTGTRVTKIWIAD